MHKLVFVAAAASVLLSACQTTQTPKPVWLRADGQSVRGNSALEQQGQLDRTICKGETQKAAVGMAPIYYSGRAATANPFRELIHYPVPVPGLAGIGEDRVVRMTGFGAVPNECTAVYRRLFRNWPRPLFT